VANALNYSAASGFTEVTSALSGSGKVTSNAGTGGLTLTAANTHTGGTEVTGGTLYVTGSGTLGAASGNVTVTGTGASEVKLDLRNQQTRTGTITMTGQNARIITDASNSGSLVNNGSIAFGGGQLLVAVSGTGGINVTGGGTIEKANTYTGDTNISATTGWFGTNTFYVKNASALGASSGNLTISGGIVSLGNYTISRSGNVTISGGQLHTGTLSKSGGSFSVQGGSVNADLAGTAGLTKSGSGTAYLGGANTYSGGTTINGGTLSALSAEGLGNATSAVTVNTGATLYTGGGLTISRTGDVTVNGGNLTTDNNNFGTINVSGGNFIANNAATLAVNLAGTAGLTVGGTGETYLWTASSYTGATVINSGQLTLGGIGAISDQSRLQIQSGAAVNLTGAYAASNINRTFAGLTGAGVLYGGGGTVTVNKTSGNDTFSGDIQGAQGLIKDGAGDLALAGSNTYAGNTTVSAGRLAVANNNALGSTAGGTTVASGAQLFLNGVTVGNETLTISGTGLSAGSSTAGAIRSANGTSNTLQGKINLAADARIFSGSSTSLTVDVASGDAINLGAFNLDIDGAGTHTVNDAIVGTGGLIKNGSGITTLAAANSYSGATDIQAGRVVLSGAGRLGSGSISVANASTGTLEFAVTGTNTMANNISGNGSLLSSTGQTRFTGAVTSTGGLTINSNSSVRIGNGGTTGSYSGDTVLGNSAAQLIFDRSDSYTHAGNISGNGSVVIAGAGTTTFTGSKTYTGLTTVSAGTLAVNGTVAGGISVDSAGTLQGNGTISGATTVSGSLNPGNSPGLLTFANSLTLGSNATTTMEITGANSSGTRGVTYDAVNVTNALTYGGTLSLNFDTLFTQDGNYTFNLFDFGSTSGSFGSVSLAGIYSGSFTNNSGIWGLTQGDNTWSFNQGDGVLTFTVVPEPNVAMVAGSLALMALLRRRRD